MLKASGADKFAQAFKNAANNVQGFEKNTSNAGLTVGKLVGAVGVTALLAKGFGLVKNSVGKAFGRIDTMEQFERVMTTLTGSTEKANSVLDEVNDTVTGTAYGLDVGAKSVQNFVTSNMDVDKATMTFKSWADAVAFYGDGTNETLAGVTDALAKATAKGKIQMDTMNRLAEAGIPAMQIYADATGQSVEDVAKLMEKGKLDADSFINVMNDAMANGTKNFKSIDGAAKEAGASWTGSFDNMKAAVARGTIAIIENIDNMLTSNGLPDMRAMVAEFGSKFESVLKTAASSIGPLVENIKNVYNNLKPWLPLIGSVVAGIATFGATVAIINTVKNAITAARTAFMLLNATILANPIALVVAAIVAAAVLIYVYWEPISEFFVGLWGKIKDGWSSFVDWFKNLFSSMQPFIKEWGVVILGLITGPMGLAVSLIYKYWEPISTFFKGIFGKVKSQAAESATTLAKGFAVAKEAVVIAFNLIKDKVLEIRDSIVSFVESVKQNMAPMTSFIGDTFRNGFDLVKELLSNLADFFTNTWANIKNIASNMWTIIKNVILGPILLLINLVTGDMEGFKENLSQIWGNIRDAGGEIWSSLTAIIGDYIGLARDNIVAVFSFIGNAIKGYWQAALESTSNIWNSITDFIFAKLGALESLVSNGMDVIRNAIFVAFSFIENIWKNALQSIMGVTDEDFAAMSQTITEIMDTIWNIIETVWNFIKETFLNGTAFLKALVSGDFAVMKDLISEQTTLLKQTLSQLWEDIKQLYKTVLSAIADYIFNKLASIEEKFTQGMNAIREILSKGLKYIENLWKTVLAFLLGDTGKKFDAMSKKISNIMDTIWDIIETVWNFIKETFLNGTAFLKALVSGDFRVMKDLIREQMTLIKNTCSQIWQNIKQLFRDVLSALVEMIKMQFTRMKTTATNLVSSMLTAVVSKFTQMRNAVQSKMIAVKTTIINGWKGAVSFLKNINLRQLGVNAIKGFINGIKSMVGAVANAAKSAADAVTGKIKSILKIASPSKLLDRYGSWTGEGFAGGIFDRVKMVAKAAKEMALAAIPDVPDFGIGGQVDQINKQANRQLHSNLTSELTVNKEPANINIRIGNSEFSAFVDDITNNQNRKSARSRRTPRMA